MIKEHLIFLLESFSEFQHTGTVCSTSPWAADQMVTPLEGTRGSQNILEVGAGTGAVTVKILERMIPGDRLTICEINPRMMKVLRERLEKKEEYQKFSSAISFFEGPIQDLPEELRFDTIISSLPFLNFDVPTVQEIFEKYARLSSPDTKMTYYEYIGLRCLGQRLSPRERKQRLRQLDEYFRGVFAQKAIGRKRVWRNFLPINIYTLKLTEARS